MLVLEGWCVVIVVDRNGEVVDIPDEVVEALRTAARDIFELDDEIHLLEVEARVGAVDIAAAKNRRAELCRESAGLLAVSDVLVPVGDGLVVARVAGRRESRSVKRDAVDRLAEELPSRVQAREVATIPAEHLTPAQIELADVAKRYPTVAEVDAAELNIVARGLSLADILDIPPDPPFELKVVVADV